MVFDQEATVQRFREFKIRNVRIDQPFDVGTKRFTANEVLVPIGGKILLGCTDERPIKELVDPKSGNRVEFASLSVARAAGATFGFVDAVRNVRVTVNREQILAALTENEVITANHIDTRAQEGELTGCGQAALRSMPESGSVFDRPTVRGPGRLRSFEDMGVLRMVLDGDHTAEGFVVNPFSDRVLQPGVEVAGHSFFSLDLGVYREIIHWVEGALGFGEEVAHSILVKLARNTFAAVFILSNSAINEAVFIERGDDQDSVFAGVLHEALAELKEREGAVLRMVEARMKG